ncbi:MAG: PP2C family protein-serine/threonine phosphatase [Actinomycetes bacterium]
MVLVASSRRLPRGRPRRRAGRRLWLWVRRHVLPTQAFLLLLLTALTVLVAFASTMVPRWVPVTSMVVVMLLGAFFLRVRAMILLYLVIASGVLYSTVQRPEPGVTPGGLAVVAVTAVMVLLFARSRERLGVQGTLGESMLVDLRDRLRAQGQIPQLPPGWHVERVLKSAYGDSFSGDFLVASGSTAGGSLELALVDVSGKGQPAGTRALLLSGAFGGLLGAMSREEFLPAANAYLLRQQWDEGFATAVHLALDLATGSFRLASAGHPPAAHFHAGSGRWELLEGESGPALGVVDAADYPARTGRLQRGDALLLYTDGLVETPGRDLGLGIDRLMGQAERLVRRGGFRGGAQWILDSTGAGENDDRALVLLWRE